jgi:hypothetical protein
MLLRHPQKVENKPRGQVLLVAVAARRGWVRR